MNIVRAAMIGDVVGASGLEALEDALPALIQEHRIDFVTVNGENAAKGFGMTEKDFKRIIAAGADVVTSGNHVWEEREFWNVLENEKFMLRPANYPEGAPGLGFVCVEKKNVNWVVINLQGREFMTPINCPFQTFEKILNVITDKVSENHPLILANGTPFSAIFPVILIDFHAESSREKEALAYYVDGRVSLIAGTHTHVQTADERIMPKGSAYISDLGMTGINDSVIGMDPKICLERVRKHILYHMEIETEKPARMHGIIAEIDADTGNAVSIKRI